MTPTEYENDDDVLPLAPGMVLTRGASAATLRSVYVCANAHPPRRVELRLVVSAGSVDEDEDERGLAHYCEHLAFQGTTKHGAASRVSVGVAVVVMVVVVVVVRSAFCA